MNGFEKHGIKHLSASNINLFSSAPDVWVARYMLGKSTPFGPAATRGKAVEHGIAASLNGEEDAIAQALKIFDRDHMLGDEKTTKERDRIEAMIGQGVEALEQYGKPEVGPNDDQAKISINCKFDDWSIPVIGYLDFSFPEHGLTVDTKSTTRVPSKMSSAHQLQRAIYAIAKGNHAVKFLYISEKKFSWLEDGDPREILATAKKQIARMERFCSKFETAEEAQAIVPVLPDSFYWSGGDDLRAELYGL